MSTVYWLEDRRWVSIPLGWRGYRAHFSRFDRTHNTRVAVDGPDFERIETGKPEGGSLSLALRRVLNQLPPHPEHEQNWPIEDAAFYAGMLYATWQERVGPTWLDKALDKLA